MDGGTNTIVQSNLKEEFDEIENKFSLPSEELLLKGDASESLHFGTESETKFSPQRDLIIKQENSAVDLTTIVKSEMNEFDPTTATQSIIEQIFIKQEEIQSDPEEMMETEISDRSNENNRNYKCSVCNFRASNNYRLKQHMEVHNELKLFECSACNYCYLRSENLTRHLLGVHVEKGRKCCICNYTNTDRDNLRVHMSSHKRDNPHKCIKCEYSSKETRKLQQHVKEHHAIVKCDQCSFKTASKSSLRQHFKHIHMPTDKKEQYICKSCYFYTLKEDEFKKHVDMHTSGVKKYRCDQCRFSDKNIAILNAHMKTHLDKGALA